MIDVRLMTASDVDAVHAIEAATFAVPWSRASFLAEVTDNRCARYMVLTEAGTPVAYAGMWLVLDEGQITNIAVRADRRGLGYGERLLRALMQLASDSGMTWMTLSTRRTNVIAQNLYHKLGFMDVGYRKRYYSDNQEDALIMVCERLPAPNPENDPYLVGEDEP